jgi:TrmH family RNA methyltransferase
MKASSPGFTYAGTHSPRLKTARRLAKRAFRDRDRAFLAEGPQAVGEAFAHGAVITDLFVTAAARSKHAALVDAIASAGSAAASEASLADSPAAEARRVSRPGDTAGGSAAGGGSGGLVYTPRENTAGGSAAGGGLVSASQKTQIHLVNDATMSELAQTVTPQGLLAVCGFVDVTLRDALAGPRKLIAVLANVRDPGNAGTVLRAADAAGADAVIFADASVDPYNAKCVRASAGSLFHLPVVVDVRLDDTVSELRAAGLRVVAADGRAGRSLDEPDVRQRLAGPTAWVFGNEAWGLPQELIELTDEAVAVPIYGQAESLNLATAAAVCLYASAQSQRVNENCV